MNWLIAIIALSAMGVGILVCAIISRINGLDADNTGSETGIERERDLKSWEGWK